LFRSLFKCRIIKHPRTAGARGLALRYSREKDNPLMAVLEQLSYVSAKHLGAMGLKAMQERGRMQEDMAADVVVFDPATVTDNSTYEKAWKPTTGMKAVIVNGTVVVRDDQVLPGYPGQPIRFPVEDKGRFEPLSPEGWVEEILVAPVGFHGLDRTTKQPEKEVPKPAAPEKDASVPADKRSAASAADRDWFSNGPQTALTAEMHALFCPIHRVVESAPDFTPGWDRQVSNN